ncbi:MAG: LLM class F420-dependent oxidoreductase [Actinomycetota bacterium]|nr:LLM class F420-dependent oxidoreductase [Actinomycetota bacterium]
MLISAKLPPVFGYEGLVGFWRAADELGYHAIWNYDHFYGIGGLMELTQPTLEGWTTLAAMAALTKRARVGCMVTGVTYRHPAVLANMAVSVDHISGGRLEIGMGAAWHEPEHRAYGITYPPAGTRIAMLDEALTLMKMLWTQERTTFGGTFWSLEDALCEPKPVQRPHPPIVVGGSGEKKTLRVVAKHADEWNTPGQDPVEWLRLNKVLDEHCAAVDRDPKEIRRGVQLFVIPDVEGNAESHVANYPAFEDAGCEHIVLSFYSPPSLDLVEKLAPRG